MCYVLSKEVNSGGRNKCKKMIAIMYINEYTQTEYILGQVLCKALIYIFLMLTDSFNDPDDAPSYLPKVLFMKCFMKQLQIAKSQPYTFRQSPTDYARMYTSIIPIYM